MNAPLNAPSNAASENPAQSLNGAARLTHLGVLELVGEDASKFIHGQLTHDFALLGADRARLTALCSPKGRMLASFIGLKPEPQRVLLICRTDVLEPMLKRLRMFVLRAKVVLRNASDDYALWGLAGSAAQADLAGQALWSVRRDGDATDIRLYPADGVERQLRLQPASAAAAPQGAPLPLDAWLWSEVRSGVASVGASVSELFVPQMLNYESVDGVNFKKGCYPGQEVVARSQFRGTLKRRAFLVHADGALAAGDEIFAEGDAEQPVGTVAQAAPVPGAAGFDAVVSLQLAAIDGPALHAAAPGGPRLQVLPLPYPLLEDI